MSLNKTAVVLILLSTIILSGCSFTDGSPLDIDGTGQTGVIDVSIYHDNSKDGNAVAESSANGLAKTNSGFEPSLAGEKNALTNTHTLETSLEKQTIYFMYDSSAVEVGFIPIIEKQSQELVKNPAQTLVLEGHTDERGSREYNIALGEQRAKAVAQIMQAHGVHSNQLEIVSYGEEKPVAFEHNETAWHFNRRVNLISLRTQK